MHDALTLQLADAVRYTLTGYTLTGGFTKTALDKLTGALTAFDAVLVTFPPRRTSPGDYPEDFAHENGNYQRHCIDCGKLFTGHKRRLSCSVCIARSMQVTFPPGSDTLTEGEINDVQGTRREAAILQAKLEAPHA